MIVPTGILNASNSLIKILELPSPIESTFSFSISIRVDARSDQV